MARKNTHLLVRLKDRLTGWSLGPISPGLFGYAASYLAGKGWQRSAARREAIDNDGPVPWVTYPALMLLERVVRPEHLVFEYGCGNGSLWWSQRAASVVSVEHDEEWAARVAAQAPENLCVVLKTMGELAAPEDTQGLEAAFFARKPELPVGDSERRNINQGFLNPEFTGYAAELARHGKGHFDIVVIDGMARVLTTWLAVHYLKEHGIIVFDNSERWQYNAAFDILAEHGFKRIDFYGSGPVNSYEWCTSIFCRDLDWASDNVRVPEIG